MLGFNVFRGGLLALFSNGVSMKEVICLLKYCLLHFGY